MGIGGAQAEFGVLPDLTTLGKAIAGGGLPVGAVAGKKEIMNLLTEKRVVHAGTFNGYPLGTAAVKTTIEILSRDNGRAYETMKVQAKKIHEIMRKTAKEEDFPLIVQGPPLCSSFHCCERELMKASEYSPQIQMKDVILNAALQKNGILISSISRIYPNITLSSKDTAWFQERVGEAIREAKLLIQELYE